MTWEDNGLHCFLVDSINTSAPAYTLPRRTPTTLIPIRSVKSLPDPYSLPISYLAVIPTPTGDVFHFTLGLIIDADSGTEKDDKDEQRMCIHLDASPSYTGPSILTRGVVSIDYRPSPVFLPFLFRSSSLSNSSSTMISMQDPSNKGASEPTLAPFVVALRAGMQVRVIFKCIFDQGGLDKYIFTDAGHGFRHFCATVLSDLSSAGIVEDAGVGETFEHYEEDGARVFGEKNLECGPWTRRHIGTKDSDCRSSHRGLSLKFLSESDPLDDQNQGPSQDPMKSEFHNTLGGDSSRTHSFNTAPLRQWTFFAQ
ncbi:hypothetical protein BDN70DRAFT_923289 [Pholiota conissans]|uniref:DUF7770 domain-containing protein n=1 Tax=Pholiota conissans TaxID=109636 RepID=A0A9P5YVY0_9AGAR|nr:hypothetical protein BDN70DRAFT_923289 [Pholiota conissans]